MTMINGTIRIPVEDFFNFVDQYNPAPEFKKGTYYGVPRPEKGGDHVLVDFVGDSVQDPIDYLEEPDCLAQWKKVGRVLEKVVEPPPVGKK